MSLVVLSSSYPAPAEKTAAPPSLFPARPVWTLALNNAVTAQPAYDAARGFFPIQDGRIVAYDLITGGRLWLTDADPRSRPAAGGDLVFLAESDRIRALRQVDGAEAWRLPLSEPLASPLVFDNGWLIAASASGTVNAFRAADGQGVWERSLGAPAHAPPSLAGDRVYVPLADGRVVALDVTTGKPVWERKLRGLPNEILALEDRLYLGSTDNFLHCLDADNGRIVWSWRTGADIVGTPVAHAGRVYFVSLDNVLRALDRNNGAQRWKRGLPLRPIAGPLRAADTLLVAGLSSPLAFHHRDGAPAGNLQVSGELAAQPYVVPGAALPTVVVVTRDIAAGATVTAFSRSIEPTVLPIAPLPNPVAVTSTP